MARVKREQQLQTIEPESQTIAEQTKAIEVEHDDETNTVRIQVNGKEVVIREPKGKDFLLLESWIRQAEGDYRDFQIALIKLASLCVIQWGKASKVSFDELFNSLETLEDVERVAAAIAFFRSAIDDYSARLEKSQRRSTGG